MASGNYVSKEKKVEILRLRFLGLTPKVISIRTRLRPDTIRKIVKKEVASGT